MDVAVKKRSPNRSEAVKRPPGRPRSEAARRAILSSTLRLLRHTGFNELSIEAVAAAANVGKATVYRWWPNKGALVVDAYSSMARKHLLFPDTGSIHSDMSFQMRHVIELFRTRRGQIAAALIGGGQTDPELIEAFRERFVRPRRMEAYTTLRKGIARGELPRNVDLDLVLDALYGAIYMRFLIWKDGLNDAFIEEICRLVLEGASKKAWKANSNGKGSPGNGKH
jgi:AcrR family transcriptional regulator